MKNLYFLLSVLLLIGISCSKPSSEQASADWTEMESFHDLMADVYHPVHDSSNLVPAKDLADELAASAKLWSESSLPERVNNDEVRKDLVILRDSSAAFLSAVTAGKPDSVLKSRISDLHHTFHRLHRAWEGSEKMKH